MYPKIGTRWSRLTDFADQENLSDMETICLKKKQEIFVDEEIISSEEDAFMERYGEMLDFTEDDFMGLLEEELLL